MRRCKKCGVEKPLTSFPKMPKCKGGRSPTCLHCLVPLRVCEWCNRTTRSYRKIVGEGYECSRERDCIAPRRHPNHGALTRLGAARVLERIENHGYHVTKAAKEIGVSTPGLSNFLRRKEPKILRQLCEQGKICRGAKLGESRGGVAKFHDPVALTRIVQRYNGHILTVAGVLECSENTVRRSLRRLAPELYAQLTAPWRQRRNAPTRHKASTSTQHPWRQRYSHRKAA
jgi:hypothetical protein